MKTVHNEAYKGFNISVQARFEEDTTLLPVTDVHYDSVFLELVVREKDRFDRFFYKEESIEKDRENRTSLHNGTKKAISKLLEESKLKIDKYVREKEMTEGLPESLLQDEVLYVNGRLSNTDDVSNTTFNITMNVSSEVDDNKLAKEIIKQLKTQQKI